MLMLGGRWPKELRKILPLYLACVLLVLVFGKATPYRPPIEASEVIKRVLAAYQRPIQANSLVFPRKIWQTWKVDPLDFDIRDSERARSWPRLNPTYRYEVLTDGNDLQYVETHYGPDGLNRPDIVNMYKSLNATIIKADLLRYLMMYVEGGVYADIDVEAMQPVEQWIPSKFDEGDVDLVISVEIDEPNHKNRKCLETPQKLFRKLEQLLTCILHRLHPRPKIAVVLPMDFYV